MINFAEEAFGIFAIQLYKPNSCKEIVNVLKSSSDWVEAQVIGLKKEEGFEVVTNRDFRFANIFNPVNNPRIIRGFDKKLDGVIKPLIKQVWRTRFRVHAQSQIVRYPPGGHYSNHSDGGLLMGERYFTVLCYLNDDFDGGCTGFPNLNYKTIPQSGKAILFPSNYVHCGEPVVRGEKYIFVTWIIGTAPIDWI